MYQATVVPLLVYSRFRHFRERNICLCNLVACMFKLLSFIWGHLKSNMYQRVSQTYQSPWSLNSDLSIFQRP